MDNEHEERASDGPARGHLFSCHLFECRGCTAPVEFCTCDYKEWLTNENTTNQN
jgi:hypothetical protein